MTLRLPVRSASLADQTVEILIERIKNGFYPSQSQIPPEHQLATEFNVSRATIRSAVRVLAERSLVVRRQGIGTFVSKASRLSNPLDEASDFNRLIANQGYKPDVQYVKVSVERPDIEVAEALNIQPDQAVLRLLKIFTADGEPLVYSSSAIPTWIFKDDLLEKLVAQPDLTEPFYDFLEEYGNQQVEYHLAKVRAEIARNCEFPNLPLDPLTPIFILEEIGHNLEEIPLWYSIAYFPGNQMTFELVRRKVSTHKGGSE